MIGPFPMQPRDECPAPSAQPDLRAELAQILESVKLCADRLARISTQLAAIDAAIYRLRTQPQPSRSANLAC